MLVTGLLGALCVLSGCSNTATVTPDDHQAQSNPHYTAQSGITVPNNESSGSPDQSALVTASRAATPSPTPAPTTASPTPSPTPSQSASPKPAQGATGAHKEDQVVPAGDKTIREEITAGVRGYKWSDAEAQCTIKLWMRESSLNPLAKNPSSGAYGIPQALPGDKMASEGADWKTNPKTQIAWGLKYIKGRYGTPCRALAHSDASGWY